MTGIQTRSVHGALWDGNEAHDIPKHTVYTE